MSSKLKGFVDTRRTATPPTNSAATPTKNERADRAQGMKVGPRSSRSRTKPPAREDTDSEYRSSTPSRNPSIDPQQRAYTSNYQSGRQYLESQNEHPHPVSGNRREGNQFDNTISTNFDHTRSESREGSELSLSGPIFTGDIDAAMEYVPAVVDGGFEEEEGENYTQHANMHVDPPRRPAQHPARPLHHKENFAQTKSEEPHMQEFPARQGSDIAGRFSGPPIQNVQARAEVLTETGRGASKKRGHSQHTHEPNNYPIRSFDTKQTGRFENDGRDVDPRNGIYEDDVPGFTSSAPADETQHPQHNAIHSSFPQDDDDLPSATLFADHSDEDLAMMDYAELKAEDWGLGQKSVEIDGAPEKASMEQKLEALNIYDFHGQSHFFCSMADEEWDEAGQLIMSKLTAIMGDVREIRKKKRAVAAKYEEIYEKREQLVRSKDEKYEAQLGRMKNRGLNVLKGS